ncbi:AraC family transcriptional regulator [Pararobbsia alpina]|uniref:AraC family transcriptional regulator n=1 Tax=Pararobbsia alpina TaxID=621374 RepID=UPI0039A77572
MDRLSALLTHFSVRAGVFFSGSFCGISAMDGSPRGHIHLVRSGRIKFVLADGAEADISEPTLVFIPRPYHHRLQAEADDQADIVCATLAFDGGAGNPLAHALPDYMLIPLASAPSLTRVLEWLSAEAVGEECGRVAAMDRLFELLVIEVLRELLAHKRLATGVIAGLADSRLGPALTLMHDNPVRAWEVAELAEHVHMSRASFAARFREVVGQTPADYLVSWRVSLAQKALRKGRPIALVAQDVGYESPSALARAFRRKAGTSPRDWVRSQGLDVD